MRCQPTRAHSTVRATLHHTCSLITLTRPSPRTRSAGGHALGHCGARHGGARQRDALGSRHDGACDTAKGVAVAASVARMIRLLTTRRLPCVLDSCSVQRRVAHCARGSTRQRVALAMQVWPCGAPGTAAAPAMEIATAGAAPAVGCGWRSVGAAVLWGTGVTGGTYCRGTRFLRFS